jgi:hypothetical protein
MTIKLSLILRGENLKTVASVVKSLAFEKETKIRKTEKLLRKATMSSLFHTIA